MQNHHAELFPGGAYHIFNRAIGNEKLFTEEENYRFFLNKYIQYISPVAETLCWCLLPSLLYWKQHWKKLYKRLNYLLHYTPG
jgi:putative transposase